MWVILAENPFATAVIVEAAQDIIRMGVCGRIFPDLKRKIGETDAFQAPEQGNDV